MRKSHEYSLMNFHTLNTFMKPESRPRDRAWPAPLHRVTTVWNSDSKGQSCLFWTAHKQNHTVNTPFCLTMSYELCAHCCLWFRFNLFIPVNVQDLFHSVNISIHSTVDGYLGIFHLGATINTAAMNILKKVFQWILYAFLEIVF